MKIGKHGLRMHLRLLAPSFGLIAAVWVLRVIVDAAGSPDWVIRMTSVTVATAVAILLAVVLIHAGGFGGYSSVAAAAFLLNAWSELLISLAILFSVATGMPNIYTAPEFTPLTSDPYHLKHLRGHLTFGLGVGTLSGSAMGFLLLLFLRLLVPRRKEPSGWDRP